MKLTVIFYFMNLYLQQYSLGDIVQVLDLLVLGYLFHAANSRTPRNSYIPRRNYRALSINLKYMCRVSPLHLLCIYITYLTLTPTSSILNTLSRLSHAEHHCTT